MHNVSCMRISKICLFRFVNNEVDIYLGINCRGLTKCKITDIQSLDNYGICDSDVKYLYFLPYKSSRAFRGLNRQRKVEYSKIKKNV